MLFDDRNVKLIFHKYLEPTHFARQILYYALEIGQVEVKKSTFIDLHLNKKYQKKFLIYLFNNSGNGVITINDVTFGINKNDSLIFSTHDNVQLLSEKGEFYYLVFDGNHSKDYYNYLKEEKDFIKFVDTTNIIMHFYKIKECISGRERINEGYVSVSIECILAEVYTINHFFGSIGDTVNMVTHAIDYIEDNFMNDIMLEDICNNIAYSPYHFSRVFKKETSMSPYDYLIHRRINHGKHLLITTNETVTNISAKCGYKSNIHFNNSFKKVIGMTPKQYRIINQVNVEGRGNE